MVLDAVRANRFWIITHPERRGTIERRAERLLAAFDAAAAKRRIAGGGPHGRGDSGDGAARG